MEQQPTNIWIWSAIAVLWLLPLLSFVIGLVLWRKRKSGLGKFSTSLLAVSTLLSWLIFGINFGVPESLLSLSWWKVGTTEFSFSLALSGITQLLLVIVNTVSLLVHVYSLEYMKDDPGKNRYFACLGLFTFSMLGIVLSDSLLLIFCFWELVGTSSYFLIGFWYKKESAALASFKAFLVNRVGDLGFLIGICLIYAIFRTLSISELQTMVDAVQWKGEVFNFERNGELITSSPFMFTVISICLLGGAVGKSAQFPLQVWLPDAMEGPTPVSALIHAATMVAAGIYFVARVFFLFTPPALFIVAFIGAITAVMGAVAAISQYDIKKVLAFSTISQLGFMVLALGVGGREEGLFHLATHAAFKAGLFLAAGSIIHAMHRFAHETHAHFDAQDMRLMGGIKKYMPTTFLVFLLLALAISGIPMFSGFLSKDAIITKAFSWASAEGGVRWLVPILALFSAFLTAFYMSRLVMLVFFGSNKTPGLGEKSGLTENGKLITIPLMVLAGGSLWIWFNWNPFGQGSWLMDLVATGRSTISGLYLETTNEIPHKTIAIISILASLTGVGLGYVMYDEDEHQTIAELEETTTKPGFWSELSFNNWYLNELYDQTVVYSFNQLTKASSWADRRVIDPLINLTGVLMVVASVVVGWFDKKVVDGLVLLTVRITEFFGNIARSFQGGAVQKYIAWSLFFTLLVVTWILIK
ncbi:MULTISPECIES: NADH-quinone oxidoreductase subunit L [unclassified Imperialibacter]|uniref:NADH-quinone oxidoreductase subunit L n=1 Tax=unclassified Imperialibacter TaxID=2629706 RepID=UPI001259FE9D|nr:MULTISPECIES: NADH-quinone oxidoreductase subunit L [unclassified Imperialibacter]CAD5272897.1 NADH-quinone oxidoreductase subunit L [Imperialibacter sp. 89]CAD5288574.1 NADH-quinone oxidoreductase subunit L [Imperialibacter sp. 75]VVT14806.1 NADH-quinone oxidoreductase subunit L [Imperialibacter sp. EC-SDR9]